MSFFTMKRVLTAAALAVLTGTSSAHSWVEEMQVISDNGSYTGDYGYTRGYMARTEGGFNGDSVDYLLPPLSSGRTRINGDDLLCHPSQRTSNYTADYPQLQITSGGYIAMKYLENGHVTLPQTQKGKPKAGGTVFIYATTQPSETEKIADVLEWTTNGSGGNKRGSLIASQNFDDGRCHQLNSGAISLQRQQQFPDRVAGQPTSQVEQWCENDVQIPASLAKAGETLSLYWVWQWPTEPGQDPSLPDGKDEYYTSCSDIKVVDSVADKGAPVHTLVQQDPQTTAVSDWKSRTAYTSSPAATLAGASGRAANGASSAVATSLSTPVSSPAYTSASAIVSASASASPIASFSASSGTSNLSLGPSSTATPISSATDFPPAGTGNLSYITYSLSYLPTFTTSIYTSPAASVSSPAAFVSASSSALACVPQANQDKAAEATVTVFATKTTTVSAGFVTVTVTAPAHAADVSAGTAGIVSEGNAKRSVRFFS